MATNNDTKPEIPTTFNKVLKWTMLALGLIAAGVTIYFLVRISWDMRTVMGYANANKSNEVPNPMPLFYWCIGAAALAGLALGVGIGMPRRSARFIRKEALEGRPASFAATSPAAARPEDAPLARVTDIPAGPADDVDTPRA